MAEPRTAPGPEPGAVTGPAHHQEIDWERAAHSREFQELEHRKRSFVVPATIFFVCWYFGFIILAGYAPDFMGEEFLTDGLTVGYVLALSQFVMTWVLGWLYLRKADREFDPLAARARQAALGHTTGGQGRGAGRFERGAGDTTTEHPEARR